MRKPRTKRLTLMCRNHEVVTFSWDVGMSLVVGTYDLLDVSHAPLGCLGRDGKFNRVALGSWIRRRGVPSLRPDASARMRRLGFDGPIDLLLAGYGLSLSDQYWLRDSDDHVCWEQVSPYLNDFPEELGLYLLARSSNTLNRLENALGQSRELLSTSPDASLGGNLPKRWAIIEGERRLIKGASPANSMQEPQNELIATELGRVLLDGGDYLPYQMRGTSVRSWECTCPCMCNDTIELVPAIHVFGSEAMPNDLSLHEGYVRAAMRHGLDVREDVEKMLVVDYLLCNFDRHWNNFGILMDSESREWLRTAPIFDTGNSLWCDRAMEEGFGGYHMRAPGAFRPFRKRPDEQLRAFCRDLSWLDPTRLTGFPELVYAELQKNPLLVAEPGRVDAVTRAVLARIDDVSRLARVLS